MPLSVYSWREVAGGGADVLKRRCDSLCSAQHIHRRYYGTNHAAISVVVRCAGAVGFEKRAYAKRLLQLDGQWHVTGTDGVNDAGHGLRDVKERGMNIGIIAWALLAVLLEKQAYPSSILAVGKCCGDRLLEQASDVAKRKRPGPAGCFL